MKIKILTLLIAAIMSIFSIALMALINKYSKEKVISEFMMGWISSGLFMLFSNNEENDRT